MPLLSTISVIFGPIQWDNTISFGNIITIFMLFFGFVAAWLKMKNRVENVEHWIEIHERDVAARQKLSGELNTNVQLLQQAMKNLADRFGRIEDEQWDGNTERRRMERGRDRRG
jgi:sensor domain CHASE-containing protein